MSTFGAGYSYNGEKITFSLDAATRNFEDSNVFDDTVLITPGLAVHLGLVSFSLSYDHYIDQDPATTVDNRDLWFGLGFGEKSDWYVAIYHDYVNEWSVSASFYF